MRRIVPLATALALLSGGVALADGSVVDDATLARVSTAAPQRVSFPAAAIHAEPAAASTATTSSAAPPASGTASSTAAGAAGVSAAGGTIRSFAADLSSTVTTPTAAGSTTYTVDERVGIDLTSATPTVTIARSSSQSSAPGAPVAPVADVSTAGTLAGKVAGVAQRISIAGNGNTVLNAATLDVTSGSAVSALGAAGSSSGKAACGSACAATADGSGIGVTIDAPGASASQGIGDGSVAQDATIASNATSVVNALHLAVGVAPAVPHAAPSLPSLATMPALGAPIVFPH